MVLAFHGGGGNAEQMVQMCGLNEKADKEGFIVVYPNGTGRLEKPLTFNAGNYCGYAMEQKVDDVASTRALLDDLATAAQREPHKEEPHKEGRTKRTQLVLKAAQRSRTKRTQLVLNGRSDDRR